MKAVGLELAEKGFELGLAKVLGQKRNESFLVEDFKGLALRTPTNNVAVVCLVGFVQKNVEIRRKMLGVPNLPS
jgi:hypothetical protein